ncbi:L-threonylcarbamoyladenylate synthase [Verrucomicrobiota bacterium]
MKSPRIVSVDCSAAPDQSVIEDAVAVLRKGALIVLPTETVYGLAADSGSSRAETRLFQAKQRSEAKPVSLLVSDCRQIEQCGAELGDAERELARRYWPGPLTLVLPVDRDGRFEGFRIPDHPVPLAVLKTIGCPLRVTSANRTGEPPALSAESAVKALGRLVDLVLDAGPVQGGVPSTVVRLAGGTFQVLRDGAIPRREIAETCEKTGLSGKECEGA